MLLERWEKIVENDGKITLINKKMLLYYCLNFNDKSSTNFCTHLIFKFCCKSNCFYQFFWSHFFVRKQLRFVI